MNDVFDEELIKELGLKPDDLVKSDPGKGKRGTGQPLKEQKAEKKPPPPLQSPEKEPITLAKDKPKGEEVWPHSAFPTAQEEVSAQTNKVSQDIPVQIAAVLAKKTLRLKDVLTLKTGEILDFNKMPQEPLDLVANGKLIAKAELVMIDGKLGARIVKLVK